MEYNRARGYVHCWRYSDMDNRELADNVYPSHSPCHTTQHAALTPVHPPMHTMRLTIKAHRLCSGGTEDHGGHGSRPFCISLLLHGPPARV